MADLVTGPDGLPRCSWADSAPEYRDYHDTEWGRQVRGDTALFERISLEAFQSGLSWLTILRKREGFRTAFKGFEPRAVAAYGEDDVERLMGDAAVVRNRRKIAATIENARALVRLQDAGGSLDGMIWSFAPARATRPMTMSDVPSATPESTALSKALKAEGFTFVGPTTMYAAMQACGLVDDHLQGCHVTR
ncbi:MAG: DNA-3-methyladenine glycosylase I [Actinomycetales bacterium]|nr:DNA-3-methyladenine glycosylase I [Actinomycetales bacterium]